MISEEEFNSLKLLPEECTLLEYSRTFTDLEFEKLCNGLRSQSMEEKWNAFMYNGSLYFYRSWTGICIYKIEVTSGSNCHSVVRAFANRNLGQYKEKDNKYDALLLDFLISNLILGENKPFPNKGSGNEPPGILQHSASGTGYSEIQYKP